MAGRSHPALQGASLQEARGISLQQLSDRTRVVAFPVASNAVGTLSDVRRITELAHGAGVHRREGLDRLLVRDLALRPERAR